MHSLREFSPFFTNFDSISACCCMKQSTKANYRNQWCRFRTPPPKDKKAELIWKLANLLNDNNSVTGFARICLAEVWMWLVNIIHNSLDNLCAKITCIQLQIHSFKSSKIQEFLKGYSKLIYRSRWPPSSPMKAQKLKSLMLETFLDQKKIASSEIL